MFKDCAVLISFLTVMFIAGCSIEDIAIDKQLIISSIKTVSEYGVYFGAKAAKLEDEKAKIFEESFRACLQIINNSTVDEFFDVDALLSIVPERAKPYIQKALDVVNSKYVELKGKIPQEKLEYITPIFSGAFDGIEAYRKTLTTVETQGDYASQLATEYEKAVKNL